MDRLRTDYQRPIFWVPKMPSEVTMKAAEYYKAHVDNSEKYPTMLDYLIAYEKKYFEIKDDVKRDIEVVD